MSSLKDLVKQREAPVGYVSRLTAHLEARPFEHRPGYHPSSISYKLCARQEALIQLGLLIPTKKIDGRLHRIFDNGHYMHERFQTWSQEMGLEVEHPEIKKRARVGKSGEVKLKHDVGISSSCDHILNLEKGWWDVVDYKSINPDSFRMLAQPLDYHEKQLTVYVGLVHDLFDGKPPAKLRGRMVYENKGNQEMKEFIVPWDGEHQELYHTLIEILKDINDAVEDDNPLYVDCSCGRCPTTSEELAELQSNPRKVAV